MSAWWGLGGCESPFTRPKNKKIATGKVFARHFLIIQRALEMQELGNVHCIPGSENPAGDLTKTRGDVAPPLRLLKSGMYNPGILRPKKGVASCGN